MGITLRSHGTRFSGQASQESNGIGDKKKTTSPNVFPLFFFILKWANGSEQDSSPGYVGHIRCADAFSAVVSEIYGDTDKKNLKLLDLGCGTGLVGKILKEKHGFVNLVGLDVSQNMLEKAKEKGIYKKLICSYVTEERVADIENAEFDGVLASGVITPGQIKPPVFDEILRWIKPG